MDLLTLQMAKNYTDDTVEGMGIQKGKNCQIQNIEDITGGHRITFAWYDEDQVLQTDTVDIMNGDEGPEGPQGPQGEVGESGVGFGPVPEVMPEGVNWWIDPNGEPNTAATINDANVSEDETWSSKKIDSKFGSNNIWDGVEEAGIINTSTGEDEESTNGRRMPHDKGITVVPGDTYYIKKTTTAKIRYTFYAADGTYIGNEDALGNTLVDTNVMSQKMIPPAGATQFRAFASSSLVNAGLTVPAGVGADIDEINGEIDNLVNKTTLKRYTLTPLLTPSSSRGAYFNCAKCGNHVVISFWGVFSVGINQGWTTIANLPQEITPSNAAYAAASAIGDSKGTLISAVARVNGGALQLYFSQSIPADAYIGFEVSYWVTD